VSPAPHERRRSFGPVVLLGLASAALAAVAGTHPWVVDGRADPAGDPVPGVELADPVAAAGEMPVALALGLVLLAAWGVVLVTRGWVRRAVAALALVAAAGLVASVVVALTTLDDQVARAILERGATDAAVTELSAWFWVAALTALLALATSGLAVAWVPAWPEMGRRYDAPASRDDTQPDGPPAEQTHLDLWRSMDEGHDPTA
jgi:uncharacterized membrane protein (TIGR02234 family)